MANILSFWHVSERTNKVGLRVNMADAELIDVTTTIVPWITVEVVVEAEEIFKALAAD